MTEPSIKDDPSRAAVRRKQVLDAATRCFRQSGFHATSIAQIGAEAGMSVGHIYRYFTNKEEIIAGIVRQNLGEARQMIRQIEAESDDVRSALMNCADRGVDMALDADHSALMIEVKAESARNPKLAEVLHDADRQIRGDIRGVISRARPSDFTEAEIEMRAEIMALIFEGLPLRIIANPTLDRAAMIQMMRTLIGWSLQAPERVAAG